MKKNQNTKVVKKIGGLVKKNEVMKAGGNIIFQMGRDENFGKYRPLGAF